jgi:3-methylfumaryl-CoA hydratase
MSSESVDATETALVEPTLVDAGFTPSVDAFVTDEHARALAATLDVDPSVLDAGELPLSWHWACFPPIVPTAALGPDGHPRRRAEIAAYPQRMWAGSRVTQQAPIRLNATARRDSTMLRTELKAGSTGTFWLMTVQHRIYQLDTCCIEEEHDIVLRAPSPLAAPAPDRSNAPDDAWVETASVDPVRAFRYSALTFNSHRIHYDLPYATQVEGYPNLVVQGPLLATLLVDFARRRSGRTPRSIDFRARAPMFVGNCLWLTGHLEADAAIMCARRGDHTIAVTLSADLA